MNRTDSGSGPRPERVTFELASGDFHLSSTDGETRLLAIAPTPADSNVVRKRRSFTNWTRNEWKAFLREAEKFERSDLLRELENLRDAVVRERISKEIPVFDDDSDEKPVAVHTLLVHYSESEGYLRVRGPAIHEHKEGLRALGLRWNPSMAEWESSFSEELLSAASEFVRDNSEAYNPDKIGYERCFKCGRWHPDSARCFCSST